MKEIADKVSEKNKNNEFSEPFTNSAEQGIISQKDYFDREIVNNENLDGYYIVRNDDFIYNPRISVTAPVGPINRNRLGRNGVMSPLYTVFRTHDIDNLYLEFYFKTTKWHRFMKLNGDSGARFDRFTISSIQFMEMPIPYPTLEEQRKIGEYFDSLDNLITLHQRILVEFAEKSPSVWEQRKLGEIAEFSKGSGYSKGDLIESGTPIILYGRLYTKYETSISEVDTYVEAKDGSVYSKGGEVIVPASGETAEDIARAATVDKSGVILGGDLNVVSPNEDINSAFLAISISHGNSQRELAKKAQGKSVVHIHNEEIKNLVVPFPAKAEQNKIVEYFSNLDYLITLHHRKYENSHKICLNDWEQRKLGDVLERRIEQRQQSKEYPRLAFASGQGVIPLSERKTNNREQLTKDEYTKKYLVTELNDIVYNPANVKYGAIDRNKCGRGLISPIYVTFTTSEIPGFIERIVTSHDFQQRALRFEEGTVTKRQSVNPEDLVTLDILVASKREEQQKIATYFDSLDNLITLHHRKLYYLIKIAHFDWKQRKLRKNADKLSEKNKNNKFLESFTFSSTQVMQMFILYPTLEEQRKIVLIIVKEKEKMPELEKIIEEKLIDQLIYGESQWTYRGDLKTEEDLWKNFKYILEQNNKDRLNGESLSDTEFEQVKNQLQFSSFYKAGEWLVGENGKVMVHIQRDTERLHLVVMNHEHIAGGSSVYEVINQYSALKTDDMGTTTRDRRFDVTLMINGLPMIHIELKNRQHSYMDAFWQIKKYISEGKFTGIFSAIQMFVVSNGVDTKYFAAAGDTELNPKFMSGWVDSENNPVSDYIDFAKSVLRIPEAHEMIARYTVLDEDAKRLILLRPYQIHAIESIREASKESKSGFVWHTTGSGKTLTSYKATRNLLMDIPAIDKAIFLIDRKDLDTQTTMAFQAYATLTSEIVVPDNAEELLAKYGGSAE